jgi:three-Cys-motif partner protein
MPTSATRTIPWVIEQQTAVKHQLLRSYIATWMNILWQQQERLRQPPHLIYVDGFAGRGEYWSTEKRDSKVDGSPILVGKVANELMRGQRKLDIIAFDTDKRTVDHPCSATGGHQHQATGLGSRSRGFLGRCQGAHQ